MISVAAGRSRLSHGHLWWTLLVKWQSWEEVESTLNNFISTRYAIASYHESGSDRSVAWLGFYSPSIYDFSFGVSAIIPPYLNLATVLFNANGYLDLHPASWGGSAEFGRRQSQCTDTLARGGYTVHFRVPSVYRMWSCPKSLLRPFLMTERVVFLEMVWCNQYFTPQIM